MGKRILVLMSLFLLISACSPTNNDPVSDEYIKAGISGDASVPDFVTNLVTAETITFSSGKPGIRIKGGHVYHLWDYQFTISFENEFKSNVEYDLEGSENNLVELIRKSEASEEQFTYRSKTGKIVISKNLNGEVEGAFECEMFNYDLSRSIGIYQGRFKAKY